MPDDVTVSQDVDTFLQSATKAVARTNLGLGTAAQSPVGDFATSTQGALADTLNTTKQDILTEGAFVDGDKTKLDGVTGTNTGDQDLSGLQTILTEGAFVDGDKTKLDGVSGSNTGDQDLSALATKANVLELDNTISFTPSSNFHPATKKYVDDNAGTGGGTALTAETSVYIDAGAMLAKDGEAEASTGTDNGTNNSVDWYNVATGETLYAKIAMPPQWDKGVIDVELYWTITGGTIGENVKWEVASQAGGNDDAWDVAFPAPTATLDDPIIADGDIHQITASSITVGGSAEDGDILHLEIVRAAAGATAASQDARLLGIRLKYSNSLLQNWYSWKLGNETADATIGIKNTWYAPAAGKVHAVAAGAASATSGSALALDVHKTGVTIFSTGITIDDAQTDTSNAATPAVLATNPTTFNAGDKFEFEVDTTTAGGAGLHCDLLISWD